MNFLLGLAERDEHYPWNFMHLKPFFFGIKFEEVGVNNIPVVPGRLGLPAGGEKKEFVLDGKQRKQCKHHRKQVIISPRSDSGTTLDTEIRL